MMKYLALLFAALFVSASFAGPIEKRRSVRADGGISFSSENVTLSNESSFHYRQSSLVDLKFGIFYLSVSVVAEGDETEGEVDGSGVFGLVYVLPSIPPTMWAAYVETDFSYSDGNLPTDAADFNLDTTASLTFSVYEKFEEIDADGKVVDTINLKDVLFSGGTMTNVAGGGIDNALTYTTYEAKTTKGDISLTIVTSNIVGKLNVGATVTPQCIEAILEVNDYDYADEANHLRLTVFGGAGSSSSKFSASGNVLVSGNDVNAPYVLLGADVLVGENADETTIEVVTVSTWEDVETSSLPLTVRSLVLGMEANAHMGTKTATVDFPAGAKFISYDPQIGFNVPGSAAALIPGLAILLSVIAAFLKF